VQRASNPPVVWRFSTVITEKCRGSELSQHDSLGWRGDNAGAVKGPGWHRAYFTAARHPQHRLATAIVEALMPDYALGQQVRKDDERIKASYETLPSPNGNGYIRGYFVRPFSQDTRSETPSKLPGVIVIHENRGLNPHTEDVARRFALENFMAFAPDLLTSAGGYPGDDYKGGQLFSKIDPGIWSPPRSG
jgi:hypothetical protein